MPKLKGMALSSVSLSRGVRPIAAAVLALTLTAGMAGCGNGGSSPVVVRVGAIAIDRATVDHWARAIALGSTVEGVTGRSNSTPREKALEFLVSANWAIGEAAERGLRVSDNALARGLKERVDAAPNGRNEFEEEITATGQTLADVTLEVKDSLALAALRESLSRSVPPVTQAQVADYYTHHLQSFRIPDRRVVDLIEEIPGHAQAVDLGKRLGPGERFRKRAIRELVPRQTPYEDAHRENGRMVQAIFATRLGRVGGPVVYHGRWVLLVVRKLVPGSIRPLGEVGAQISDHLSEERHRRALASFLEAFRREWTAKTSCEPGFVVQKCSEYRGQLVSEGNPLEGG
jgi:hypothetical protein